MGECFNGLSEAERFKQKIKRLQTERDCLQLAKDIYKYIEDYPERCKALMGKTITITPVQSLEAKQRESE